MNFSSVTDRVVYIRNGAILYQWKNIVLFILAVLFMVLISATGGFNLPAPPEIFQDDCLIPVLRQAKPPNVLLICSSNASFCPLTTVNHVTGTSWTWTLLDDARKTTHHLRRDDICVIGAENDTHETLLLFEKCHRARILLEIHRESIPDPEEYWLLFDRSWNLGIIDIVVIFTDGLNCFAYSYVPFQPNGKCYDTSPVLLDSWEKTGSSYLDTTATFFPENKISSLHNCGCKIGWLGEMESTLAYYIYIMRFLGIALKCQILGEYMFGWEYEDKTTIYNGVLLSNSRLVPSLLNDFVTSFYVTKLEVVLVIPARPRSSLEWFRILDELSPSVWCAVALSFAVSVVAFYVFLKDQAMGFGVLLYMVRPLVSASCPDRAFSWHARMYLGFWIMFCFIVDSIYLCTLLSKLTVPFFDDEIKTLDDFVKSDLVLHRPKDAMNLTDLYIPPKSFYEPLKEKIVYVNRSYGDMQGDPSHDAAYLIIKDDFLGYLSQGFRLFPGEAVFSTAVTRYVLPRPSPYERFFEIAMLRSAGAGALVDQEKIFLWQNSQIKKFSDTGELVEPEALSLNGLSAIFAFLLAGYIGGLFAFLIELCLAQLCCFYPIPFEQWLYSKR